MDAMFNVFGFGMSTPEEKYKFFEQQKEKNIAAQKEKRGIFWANRDQNQIKKKRSNLEDFDISSMDPAGAGNLDQKTRQDASVTTPFHPGQGNKNFEFRPDEKTGKSLAENWLGMDFNVLKKKTSSKDIDNVVDSMKNHVDNSIATPYEQIEESIKTLKKELQTVLNNNGLLKQYIVFEGITAYNKFNSCICL